MPVSDLRHVSRQKRSSRNGQQVPVTIPSLIKFVSACLGGFAACAVGLPGSSSFAYANQPVVAQTAATQAKTTAEKGSGTAAQACQTLATNTQKAKLEQKPTLEPKSPSQGATSHAQNSSAKTKILSQTSSLTSSQNQSKSSSQTLNQSSSQTLNQTSPTPPASNCDNQALLKAEFGVGAVGAEVLGGAKNLQDSTLLEATLPRVPTSLGTPTATPTKLPTVGDASQVSPELAQAIANGQRQIFLSFSSEDDNLAAFATTATGAGNQASNPATSQTDSAKLSQQQAQDHAIIGQAIPPATVKQTIVLSDEILAQAASGSLTPDQLAQLLQGKTLVPSQVISGQQQVISPTVKKAAKAGNEQADAAVSAGIPLETSLGQLQVQEYLAAQEQQAELMPKALVPPDLFSDALASNQAPAAKNDQASSQTEAKATTATAVQGDVTQTAAGKAQQAAQAQAVSGSKLAEAKASAQTSARAGTKTTAKTSTKTAPKTSTKTSTKTSSKTAPKNSTKTSTKTAPKTSTKTSTTNSTKASSQHNNSKVDKVPHKLHPACVKNAKAKVGKKPCPVFVKKAQVSPLLAPELATKEPGKAQTLARYYLAKVELADSGRSFFPAGLVASMTASHNLQKQVNQLEQNQLEQNQLEQNPPESIQTNLAAQGLSLQPSSAEQFANEGDSQYKPDPKRKSHGRLIPEVPNQIAQALEDLKHYWYPRYRQLANAGYPNYVTASCLGCLPEFSNAYLNPLNYPVQKNASPSWMLNDLQVEFWRSVLLLNDDGFAKVVGSMPVFLKFERGVVEGHWSDGTKDYSYAYVELTQQELLRTRESLHRLVSSLEQVNNLLSRNVEFNLVYAIYDDLGQKSLAASQRQRDAQWRHERLLEIVYGIFDDVIAKGEYGPFFGAFFLPQNLAAETFYKLRVMFPASAAGLLQINGYDLGTYVDLQYRGDFEPRHPLAHLLTQQAKDKTVSALLSAYGVSRQQAQLQLHQACVNFADFQVTMAGNKRFGISAIPIGVIQRAHGFEDMMAQACKDAQQTYQNWQAQREIALAQSIQERNRQRAEMLAIKAADNEVYN